MLNSFSVLFLRGRTGFDGGNDTEAACRGSILLVKKMEKIKRRTTANRCLIKGMPFLLHLPAVLEERRPAG